MRAALVPRLGSSQANGGAEGTPFGFATPAAASAIPLSGDMSYFGKKEEHILASYQVKSSSLDRMQELLLNGDRRKAYHYALDQKMWAHAMLISSSMDKEAWKEVVSEFVKTELGVDNSKSPSETSNGRESLRVAYGLFAGEGAAASKSLPSMLL